MLDQTLNDYVRESLDDPVDFSQILNALDGRVNIVKYLDLASHSSLLDIFDDSKGNNVIIYYPVESAHDGHFVAMMFYPERNLISYFCPYGMDITGDISHSPFLMRQDDRRKFMLPELARQFQEDGGFMVVNHSSVQSRSRSVATCGKHCTFRIVFRDIVDPDSYVRFLKYESLTPDEIVSLAFI